MRILHIHPSMKGGGIEAMICGLANEMAKTEDVTVCGIFKPKENDVFWKRISSDIKRVHLGKSNPGFSLSEIFKIYSFIKKGKFDVVNLHGFLYYYLIAVILLHRKVKFFYTVHSDAMMENSTWDRRLIFLKRFCFKYNWVRPITISEVSRESFTQFYNMDSRLIPNGVQRVNINELETLDEYRITPSTKLFIHAGRINRAKNQVVLCKVFKQLINEGYDIVLLIVGANNDPEIYSQIEPYFCERIKYLGERDNIPQLMAHCDAMCLPSIWEGLPVTLLESLSVGCIPICSPVGGIPNVINDGVNGFLSKSSCENDYTLVVKRYLALSTDGCKIIKTNCIKSFEEFDISNTTINYLDYYKEALEQ